MTALTECRDAKASQDACATLTTQRTRGRSGGKDRSGDTVPQHAPRRCASRPQNNSIEQAAEGGPAREELPCPDISSPRQTRAPPLTTDTVSAGAPNASRGQGRTHDR